MVLCRCGTAIGAVFNLEKPMATMKLQLFRSSADGDEEIEVELPAVWVICSHCRGEGKSSSYLGAITSDEWHNDWDPEEQERYIAGEYDRPCTACEGLGRQLELDPDAKLTDLQREAIAYHEESAREAAQDRRTAWFESGCPE